jgi:phage terminase large subunit-like protein
MKVRLTLTIFIICAVGLPLSAQSNKSRVASDLSRLSAILLDSQNQQVTISAAAWRVTGNEANALANRIAANASGQKAARDLRTPVHEMQTAALSGDAAGAQSHAGMAMPFVYQLSDWASK